MSNIFVYHTYRNEHSPICVELEFFLGYFEIEVGNLMGCVPMKTALYDKHCQLGAKIIDFAGWEMPLQYKGILSEHQAVRERVGVFDVSHMGRVAVRGKEAEVFLDSLSTNKILGKRDLSATYTVLTNEQGGSVDDTIVYKELPTSLFLIVNAANREKDLQHLRNMAASFEVEVRDFYDTEGILAIQGPHALHVISEIFPEAAGLKTMRFLLASYKGEGLILSATGYTGEKGFEIYAPGELIPSLWDRILEKGKECGIEPCGLGARNTLRLEMGYALYGHELSEEIAPTESVSGWTVKFDHDFLGKQPLLDLEENPSKRREYGLMIQGKGIPRDGYKVMQGDTVIGSITSGSFSPTLNKGVAIMLAKAGLQTNEQVQVVIRENRVEAAIVPLPFFKK